MLRLLAILKNTRAAIDLASIMVGIIVIGIIGGIIAASIFAIIPWSQDHQAKQQLDAVGTAESAYSGLNNGQFTANLGSLLNTSTAGVHVKSDESTCYLAFKQSGSGNVYYTSSKGGQATAVPRPWPTTAPSNVPANCVWPSSSADALSDNITNIITNPVPNDVYSWGYEAIDGSVNQAHDFPRTGGPQNDGYERLDFIGSSYTADTTHGVVFGPESYYTPLKTNTTYTFSEMIRPSVTITTAKAAIYLIHDTTGADVTNISQPAGTFPANKWTELTYTFNTGPQIVNGFYPQFRVTGAETASFTTGVTLDGTEAMLTEGSAPRAFSDGDTPGWKWSGDSNNSMSSGPTKN